MDRSALSQEEMRAIKRAFASEFLGRSPRVHSVGVRRTTNGDLCLVASGSEKGLARLPSTYQGVSVVRRRAGVARPALAGDF